MNKKQTNLNFYIFYKTPSIFSIKSRKAQTKYLRRLRNFLSNGFAEWFFYDASVINAKKGKREKLLKRFTIKAKNQIMQ